MAREVDQHRVVGGGDLGQPVQGGQDLAAPASSPVRVCTWLARAGAALRIAEDASDPQRGAVHGVGQVDADPDEQGVAVSERGCHKEGLLAQNL